MKLSLMLGGCTAAIMTAAMLFAQTEQQGTITKRGLEDDSENEEISVPSDLIASKPAVESFSADAIAQSAAAANSAPEKKTTIANEKSLTVEGIVVPPSSDLVKTLEEAVRNILGQANKQVGTVSSNGIEKLVMPYQQLGDGKSFEIEWRKALRILLTPVDYNFTEDGDLVLFGLAEEVDIRHKKLAQERLTANRTPILFTTNEAEGGLDLRTAIRNVAEGAGVTITTDYMERSDLYVPVQSIASQGTLTAEEIGKAKEQTVVQQSNVKRTTFDTNGQQVEWRIVLREILAPHDYDFIEVGGVVRIAKRAKLAKWEQDAVAKKPLTAKVIRLYHADPEAVVERVKKIKGLLKHPNASLQATRKKGDDTEVINSLNSRIQSGSGSKIGMNDSSGQVFNKLVRPRTIPAIIAYDLKENMDAIEAAIRLFDIKEKQILIEAIIFELNTDNGSGDIDGVQWSGFENFIPLYGSIGGNAANVVNQFQDLTFSTDTGTRFRGFNVRDGGNVWMRTDGVDFRTMIQLIRKKNNAKLLSSPMLVVGDHSEAAIQVSRIDPVPDPESNYTDNGSGTQRETTNMEWLMVNSGVLMWVSPEITENGTSVRLTVHPQVVSKLDPPVEFIDRYGVKYENYRLTSNEIDTRATVPSGATLMFGGLIRTEESVQEDKVRWLGDIPLIGWLFRSKKKVMEQRNLVIMVRPTILEDDEQTGFEVNALKEAKPLLKNTGRELKSTPLEGPNSFKKTSNLIQELYDERVVKAFEDDEAEEEEEDEEYFSGPSRMPQASFESELVITMPTVEPLPVTPVPAEEPEAAAPASVAEPAAPSAQVPPAPSDASAPAALETQPAAEGSPADGE